jgi:hypothetical protein
VGLVFRAVLLEREFELNRVEQLSLEITAAE